MCVVRKGMAQPEMRKAQMQNDTSNLCLGQWARGSEKCEAKNDEGQDQRGTQDSVRQEQVERFGNPHKLSVCPDKGELTIDLEFLNTRVRGTFEMTLSCKQKN